MRHGRLTLVAAALATALACDTGPLEAECSDDPAEDEAAKQLAGDYAQSQHELIACGQITTQFATAVVETAATFATEQQVPPDALVWDGEVYRLTGKGLVMEIQPQHGADTPGGAIGTPLGADLFDPDAFLVDPVGTSAGDDLVVTFTAPGPLVALLGKGPAPTSPLRLTPDDLLAFGANLASIELDVEIWIDDTFPETVVTWHVKDGGGAAGDVVATGAVDLSKIDGASGANEGLGQSMDTTLWDVVYVDPSSLQGRIEAEVTGGPFDYRVSYDYLASGTATITYECL